MENLKDLQPRIEELERLKDELERRNAINKIEVFAKRYLPHYFSKNFSDFHRELFDTFESPQINKREAIASPRGTGKSAIVTTLFPLWAICTKRKKFIIIISESCSLSEQWLMGISRELEGNFKLIKDFGNLVGTEKWKDTEIETSTGIRVVAKGTGSAMRGGRSFENRPDAILADDLQSEANSRTEGERLGIEEWFDKAVLQLPGAYPCDFFLIGTIIYPDDLLSKYLKEWKGKTYKIIDDDGKLLWEDMYSREWVEDKRRTSPLAFSSEFMNTPVSYKDVKITRDKLGFYDIEDIMDKSVRLYFGVDPAQSKKNHSDFSAVVCVARVEEDSKLYIVDCFAKRIGYRELIETLFSFTNSCCNLFKDVKIENILFEDNAFQYIIKEEFEKLVIERGVNLPVKGIKNIVNKNLRISSIYPSLESKSILFRESSQQNMLINQLVTFPHCAYDDICDALATAINSIRSGRNKYGISTINIPNDRISKNIDKDDEEESIRTWKLNSDGQFVREIRIG